LKECEKIQRAFQDKGIYLILRECEDMYKIWSDEIYCAGWEGGLEDRSEDDIFELLLPWLKNIIADRLNRFEVIYNQLKENKFIK
jgi:hypothetical protein